jgi:hypothetical protein
VLQSGQVQALQHYNQYVHVPYTMNCIHMHNNVHIAIILCSCILFHYSQIVRFYFFSLDLIVLSNLLFLVIYTLAVDGEWTRWIIMWVASVVYTTHGHTCPIIVLLITTTSYQYVKHVSL